MMTNHPQSWEIWITLIIVFNGLGNLSLATMRYRSGERGFFSALIENYKWLPILFIFLGGIVSSPPCFPALILLLCPCLTGGLSRSHPTPHPAISLILLL